MSNQYALTENQSDLQSVVDRARSSGRLGIDTEFLWEKTYAPRLCVVQLTAGDDAVLVDALAKSIDLRPIAAALADPDVEIVMHAPHADLVAFALHFGCQPTNVFDIQLAAGFVGIGAGLAYDKLVREVTGRKITKGEGYTDWSRRPLNPRQLRYAAADVESLFEIADDLHGRLDDLGRASWARDEMINRYERAGALVPDPLDAWQKVGRRGRLDRSGARVLRRVAGWREEAARRRDIPSSWLVKDASLVEIARRAPESEADLRKIRGLPQTIVDRHCSAILKAVREADGDQLPRGGPPPPPGSRERLNATKGIATSVLRMRCDAAHVSPELVGTSKDIEALSLAVFAAGEAEPDPAASPLLSGWRRDIVGEELVELLRGGRALRILPHEPFVEIVEEVGASR